MIVMEMGIFANQRQGMDQKRYIGNGRPLEGSQTHSENAKPPPIGFSHIQPFEGSRLSELYVNKPTANIVGASISEPHMNANSGSESELGNLSQNGQMSSPNDLRSSTSATTQSYAVTAPDQRYQSYAQQVSVHSAARVAIDHYISKLANNAKIDTKVERLAIDIAHKTSNHFLADGKSPHGLAAAYIYMAATLLGSNLSQVEISEIAGITEVTIRNRCKDILCNFKIAIKLKPQQKERG
jgi:hypothetical protein